MKAIQWIGNSRFEVDDIPEPELPEGGAIVRTKSCGICGSDLVKIRDHLVEPFDILGHEVAGVIERLDGDSERFSEGDKVVVAHHVPCGKCHYCMHGNETMCEQFKRTNIEPGGLAEYFAISSKHLETTTLKITIPYYMATLTEPLACCLRSIDRCDVMEGDVAWVVGSGFIGLLMVQILKMNGLKVIATDLDEDRLELATKLGADFAYPARSRKALKAIRELSDGRGADFIIQTAGTSKAYEGTFRFLRDGGTINVFSSVSKRDRLTVDLNEIYYRDVTVIGSYSATPQFLKKALDMITEKIIKVVDLITDRLPPEKINEGIKKIYRREAIKVIVEF